ncbi:hypothetical protein PoB_006053300 [Plakobranchus ocellatus]|uniref:UDENN domain-containing protein n=1 Tax=Plakobranchus ocellatus TaxID=259542 RepID=A0AAV4CQ47_9GAST|nr:hypothetical protein PoB_006053300 [Plakobranchus ocellatus]
MEALVLPEICWDLLSPVHTPSPPGLMEEKRIKRGSGEVNVIGTEACDYSLPMFLLLTVYPSPLELSEGSRAPTCIVHRFVAQPLQFVCLQKSSVKEFFRSRLSALRTISQV